MEKLFSADPLARPVWLQRIRGGVIPTAAEGETASATAAGMAAVDTPHAVQRIETGGGRYRILESVRPGTRRTELLRRYNPASLQRDGQHSPWTFSGNTVVMCTHRRGIERDWDAAIAGSRVAMLHLHPTPYKSMLPCHPLGRPNGSSICSLIVPMPIRAGRVQTTSGTAPSGRWTAPSKT